MDTQIDSSEMTEYSEQMVEDSLHGNEAGQAFARKHIIEKMNLFLDEYRRNGYDEWFIKGFVDGVNDVTGGVIYLEENEADEETEELLDNPPESDSSHFQQGRPTMTVKDLSARVAMLEKRLADMEVAQSRPSIRTVKVGEKLARDPKSAAFHDLMARQTIPLVKALREARAALDQVSSDDRMSEAQITAAITEAAKERDDALESLRVARWDVACLWEERDEARAEVERLRSAISRFVTQYPWQDGPEIQELKALKEGE